MCPSALVTMGPLAIDNNQEDTLPVFLTTYIHIYIYIYTLYIYIYIYIYIHIQYICKYIIYVIYVFIENVGYLYNF